MQGMLPTCYTDCRKAQSADTTVVKRSEPLTTNPLTDSEEEDEILEAMLEEASRYDGVQDVIDQLILLAKPGAFRQGIYHGDRGQTCCLVIVQVDTSLPVSNFAIRQANGILSLIV